MASSSPAGHPAPDCPAMVRSSLHSNASSAQPPLTRQGSTNCAQDWASLSQPLLGHIFAVALEGANNDSAEGLVRERQHLALVCKAWKYVAEQVSVCALLSRPAHVGAAARAWLQRRPVEALALHPDLLDDTPAAGLRNSGFFLSLLGGADFAAQSRMHLRTLLHAGVEVLPALAPFRELRKLHLSSNDEQAPLVVDTWILGTLTKLHCLSITGYFDEADWSLLPPSVHHLHLSMHCANRALLLGALPPGLEHLCAKAEMVALDWDVASARCAEATICAGMLVLGFVGQAPAGAGAGAGPGDPQDEGRRFAAALQAGSIAQAVLAFGALGLFSGSVGDWHLPHGRVSRRVPLADPDTFLEGLRIDLPGAFDISPGLEQPVDFIRDRPADEPVFVLSLSRQQDAGPRSYHFTTPISDRELEVLIQHPVWRLAWCEDPRADQVLTSSAFLSQSADTLTELLGVVLSSGWDLSVFSRLHTLAVDACRADVLADVRLPPSLRVLSLAAEVLGDMPHSWEFDAACLSGLSQLSELSLERFAIHRLEELPASCTSLRFIDPLLEHGQPFCGPGSVEFPRWYPEPMSLTSSSISDCSFMTAGSDSDSDSGGSARPPPVVAAAASPGERGNGHQHAGADVDDGHDCTDPNCPLHSGKRVIQLSWRGGDFADSLPVLLPAIMRAGFQLGNLGLGPQCPEDAGLILLHEGWATFMNDLTASCIDVLEFNAFKGRITLMSVEEWERHGAGAAAQSLGLALHEALQQLEQHPSGAWEVKCWDGNNMSAFKAGAQCFVLIRKKALPV